MAFKLEQLIEDLATSLVLGELLNRVREHWGGYELLAHWQQGEFHHDVVIRVHAREANLRQADLPEVILVVATNCNGGVKEVLCFGEMPNREALWHARCPDSPEFSGGLPQVLAHVATAHWFDPCELLTPEARSEYREEFRERQCGGGWMLRRN